MQENDKQCEATESNDVGSRDLVGQLLPLECELNGEQFFAFGSVAHWKMMQRQLWRTGNGVACAKEKNLDCAN